jgi:hypothetical protein
MGVNHYLAHDRPAALEQFLEVTREISHPYLFHYQIGSPVQLED